MFDNDLKLDVHELELNMFVSRLDRPWAGTPFLFEGFLLKSAEDQEQIRKLCNHVYIDTTRGDSPAFRMKLVDKEVTPKPFPGSTSGESSRISNELTRMHKYTYSSSTSIEKEVKVAENEFVQLQGSYDTLLGDLQLGRELDVNTVKNGIEAMVSSILRNPSAFMLVNQMKLENQQAYARALGTSVWCASFGRHLGLEREDIDSLALGGMLLDIGKTRLPQELLEKKSPLSTEEHKAVENHVNKSIEMLVGNPAIPSTLMRMVETHHERADGSGYPKGLKSVDIPIFGQIAGIVDSYDAMTAKSFYRNNVRAPHEAINELYQLKGKGFQKELIEQFIQTVGLYPTGSLIELSTGEVAVVVEINHLRRLRPSVMVLMDSNKEHYEDFKIIDLAKMEMSLSIKQGLPPNSFGIKMDELFI